MQPINEMKVSDPNEAGVLQVLKLYKYTSPIVYTGTFFILWNLPVSSWADFYACEAVAQFLQQVKIEVKQSCFQFVEKAFLSNDEVKSR